jgi:hypothetical protein
VGSRGDRRVAEGGKREKRGEGMRIEEGGKQRG